MEQVVHIARTMKPAAEILLVAGVAAQASSIFVARTMSTAALPIIQFVTFPQHHA